MHLTDLILYKQKLKAAGENEVITEIHIEMLGKLIEEKLTINDDIKTLGICTSRDIATLDNKLEKSIAALDNKLEKSIAALDNKLEKSITALDNKIDKNIAVLDHKVDKVDSKLNWLIALISILGGIIALGNNLTVLLHNIHL